MILKITVFFGSMILGLVILAIIWVGVTLADNYDDKKHRTIRRSNYVKDSTGTKEKKNL